MLNKTSTLLCVYWLSLKKIDLEWFIWSTLRSLATMPPGTFLLAVLLSYKDFFFFHFAHIIIWAFTSILEEQLENHFHGLSTHTRVGYCWLVQHISIEDAMAFIGMTVEDHYFGEQLLAFYNVATYCLLFSTKYSLIDSSLLAKDQLFFLSDGDTSRGQHFLHFFLTFLFLTWCIWALRRT